jgi:hypothetical protein
MRNFPHHLPHHYPPRLPVDIYRDRTCRPCPSCCAGFVIALLFGVGLGVTLCLLIQWAMNP